MRIENSRQLASFAKEIRQENERKSQFDVTVFVDGMVRGSGSLLLQINPTGTMQFRYMQRFNGKREFIKVGTYSGKDKDLFLAQEQARKYGELAVDLKGICSVKSQLKQTEHEAEQELAEKNDVGRLEDLIDDYCYAMQREGKRTFAQVKNQLRINLIGLLVTEANKITSYDISVILARLIDRNAMVQANRVRSFMHAMFAFAIRFDNDPLYINRGKKYRVAINPVASVPRQNHAENVRDRVLSNEELKSLFQACKHSHFSTKLSYLIRLLFLFAGQRPNELLASEWSHFDLQNGLWNLPDSLTKNKKKHVVPITSTATKLLAELKQYTGHSIYLFPQSCCNKTMTTQALSQAIRRFYKEKNLNSIQPRDFRRTVKTKMGELGVSKLTRDRIQNHIQSDISSKHYDRYDYLDEKRSALNKWEKCLIALGI